MPNDVSGDVVRDRMIPLFLAVSIEDLRGDAPDEQKLLHGVEVGVLGPVGVGQRQIIIAFGAVEPVQVVGVFPVQDGIDDDIRISGRDPGVDQRDFSLRYRMHP